MNKIKQLDDLDYMSLDEFFRGTYRPFEYYCFFAHPHTNIDIKFRFNDIKITTGNNLLDLALKRILSDDKDISIHIDLEKRVFSLKKGVLPSIEFFRVNFDNYILSNAY